MIITSIRKFASWAPFYAVLVGRKPGIYTTFEECKAQVAQFPNAKYKEFPTQEDAEEFIHELIVNKPTAVAARKFVTREILPKSPVVYTDGCVFNHEKPNVVVGIGVYWAPDHPSNVSEYFIVDKPTPLNAELRAASRALEIAKDMGLNSIELRTDSLYTVKAMKTWVKRWENNGWKGDGGKPITNVEEIIRLDELCEEVDVTWVHVHGHSGVYGNKQADRLAKNGAKKGMNVKLVNMSGKIRGNNVDGVCGNQEVDSLELYK